MKIFKRIKAFYILLEFVVTVTIVIFLMKLFNKHNYTFRKYWSKIQRYLIGYRLIVKGQPDPKAKMVVMNHQSLLDIVVMESVYPQNLAWVAKKEIADIKFFGQILTLPNMIILDRDDRRSLVKLLKDVKDRLKDGRVIGIFPEGTRSRGDKLLKFKSGAKMIAQKLDLIVQPVVIVGTREIMDSQNFLAGSGTVKIIYLESVDPKLDPNWYEKLKDKMQETLVNELQLLKNH
jgi:1-acyl-sn-glycerol-3-phosphate acyltransferase